MKHCQGDCHRNVQEYYVMPDKKVLCYDCWKRGIERAERMSQAYKSNLDNRWKDYQSAKQEYDNIGTQIQALREKIKYEKQQAGKDYYPDDVESYADTSYIPYNYAKVKSMERDLEILYRKRDNLEPRTHLRSPQPISAPESVQYYRNGIYYDSVQAKAYEQAEVTKAKREAEEKAKKEQEERERKQREEEERIRREKERLERINIGNITKDDFPFIEANPKDYLTKITNKGALQTIARESTNNEVIAYLMNSCSEEVLIALSDNPVLSAQDLSILYDKELTLLRKHIEQSSVFHDLQKYRFLQLEAKGGEIDISYLPLIEEMYYGDTCLVSGYDNKYWHPEKIPATGRCMTTLVKNTKNQSCWRRILKEDYDWRLAFLENPNLTEEYIEKLANDRSVTVLEALINNPRFSPKAKQIAKQHLKAVRDERRQRSPYNTSPSPVTSSSGCCIWLVLFVSISLVAACTLF